MESRPSQATTRSAIRSWSTPSVSIANADHPLLLPQQLGDLGVHDQLVRRLAPSSLGDKSEEVPLRHQGDVLVASRQPAQIGDRDLTGVELGGQRLDVADRRQRVELLSQAELVEHGQGRGMHRVPAEVAEEVAMLLQHRDLNPGTGEQQAQHEARRTPADDATRRPTENSPCDELCAATANPSQRCAPSRSTAMTVS